MSADLASVPSESDPRQWTVTSRADGDGDAVDIRIEIDGYSVTIALYEEGASTHPESLLCVFSPEQARVLATRLVEAADLVKDIPNRL
jgi:hypothetical protein